MTWLWIGVVALLLVLFVFPGLVVAGRNASHRRLAVAMLRRHQEVMRDKGIEPRYDADGKPL